ncbi:MAG: hypothetical protein RMX65_013120 [Nostoc sp. DedQUE01]
MLPLDRWLETASRQRKLTEVGLNAPQLIASDVRSLLKRNLPLTDADLAS